MRGEEGKHIFFSLFVFFVFGGGDKVVFSCGRDLFTKKKGHGDEVAWIGFLPRVFFETHRRKQRDSGVVDE